MLGSTKLDTWNPKLREQNVPRLNVRRRSRGRLALRSDSHFSVSVCLSPRVSLQNGDTKTSSTGWRDKKFSKDRKSLKKAFRSAVLNLWVLSPLGGGRKILSQGLPKTFGKHRYFRYSHNKIAVMK